MLAMWVVRSEGCGGLRWMLAVFASEEWCACAWWTEAMIVLASKTGDDVELRHLFFFASSTFVASIDLTFTEKIAGRSVNGDSEKTDAAFEHKPRKSANCCFWSFLSLPPSTRFLLG